MALSPYYMLVGGGLGWWREVESGGRCEGVGAERCGVGGVERGSGGSEVGGVGGVRGGRRNVVRVCGAPRASPLRARTERRVCYPRAWHVAVGGVVADQRGSLARYDRPWQERGRT